MQQSTNYNFNLPEGTDLVNLLTQLIPNWARLDSILRGIQNDTFETATETVALGVHALTRLDPDAKLLKWVATANYTAGETFTVDGTPIAASTPSGNTLATGAYVSGAIVIAAINSDETAMTVFVTGTNVASDSERLGGELPSYYATDQDMDTANQNIEDLDNLMGNTSISAIGDGTVTGAISSIESDLTELERSGFMPSLDYANPLYTFDSTHLTFAATEDCYLVGNITNYTGANLILNIDNTPVYKVGGNPATGDTPCVTIFNKLKAGNTVTLSTFAINASNSLHIFAKD
ncbi:MAG: hypothetical protein J6T10_02565 [Methanobrevibacter sp.]|nr:hypothetical protein [Methanobrevibacter sp.]